MVKKSLSSHPQVVDSPYKNITSQPIDLGAMINDAHDPRAGAVVFFSGEVRNHSAGREVLRQCEQLHRILLGKGS